MEPFEQFKKPEMEGGVIDIDITAEELEILYSEGELQFLSSHKRLIKMKVVGGIDDGSNN